MQNLQIEQDIRLSINNDPNRIISFNPKDTLFAEKFYLLMSDFKVKLDEYSKRAEVIDANKALDENKLPVNMQERFDLLKDVCGYIRGQIDGVFGEGTSQTVFGDALSLEAFTMFFEGVAPFMATDRTQKIQKYIPPVEKPKRVRRK